MLHALLALPILLLVPQKTTSMVSVTSNGPPQSSIKHWVISISSGFFTIIALFWLMQVLIQNTDQVIDDSKSSSYLDFIRIKPTKQQHTRPEKPIKPKVIPKTPDMPPLMQSKLSIDNSQPVRLNIKPSMNMGDTNFILAPSSGDYLPLVRIAPIYPENARRRSIEGNCIVQFDVNEQGATRNVRILECDSRYFHRSSINAVSRFKYQPRIVNGKAVAVKNVKTRFKYHLEDN